MARPAKDGDGDEQPGRALMLLAGMIAIMGPPWDTGPPVPEGFPTRWIPPGGRGAMIRIQQACRILRWVRAPMLNIKGARATPDHCTTACSS